jgi:hypothetical protein
MSVLDNWKYQKYENILVKHLVSISLSPETICCLSIHYVKTATYVYVFLIYLTCLW